jgi:hypothetical protein
MHSSWTDTPCVSISLIVEGVCNWVYHLFTAVVRRQLSDTINVHTIVRHLRQGMKTKVTTKSKLTSFNPIPSDRRKITKCRRFLVLTTEIKFVVFLKTLYWIRKRNENIINAIKSATILSKLTEIIRPRNEKKKNVSVSQAWWLGPELSISEGQIYDILICSNRKYYISYAFVCVKF